MKKFYKIYLFIFLFSLIFVNGEEIKGDIPSQSQKINISPWAVSDLNDAGFYGIYPLDKIKAKADYKKIADKEDLDTLYKFTKEKLGFLGISVKNENFNFKDFSRREILSSINFLLNTDSSFSEKIFFGSKKDDYLGAKIPLEEAISLYVRATRIRINESGKAARGFFYEATKNGSKAYLFGSIHLGTNEMYPLKDEILKAFKESEILYFEIDLTDPDLQNFYDQEMFYKDEGSLKKDLGDDLYKRLEESLKKLNLNIKNLDKVRPWAIYSTLSMDHENKYGKALGVERYFLFLRQREGKKIGELENAQMQSNLFTRLSTETYKELIKNILDELDKNSYKNINRGLYLMQKAWIQNDLKNFNNLIGTEASNEADNEYNKSITDDRDEYMAKKIDEILKEKNGRTIFVVIGAAHVAPENSVRGFLKDMGYNVSEK